MKLRNVTLAVLGWVGVVVIGGAAERAKKAEFAPMVEQTLRLGVAHVIALPGETQKVDSNAPTVRLMMKGERLFLAISNIYNGRLEREKGIEFWNTMTASNVVKQYADAGFALLPHEREGEYEIKREQLPLTIYLFGNGFLQVTEISDGGTPRVKIRYKMARRWAA